jgi:exodeoxyribonuclease-5
VSIIPTKDQKRALGTIREWYSEGGSTPLTLGGYAGTGKTTLLGQMRKRLPAKRIVFCSYTGKAVSVLRSKLPPNTECSTLHRLLYTPTHRLVCKESGDNLTNALGSPASYCDTHRPRLAGANADESILQGREPCIPARKLDWLQNLNPLDGIDLVVVDEASMVTDKIWSDLTKWGVPVLAVGDHGQLPPIKSQFNLMQNPQIKLETIIRQAAESPIIQLSILAREGNPIRRMDYGSGVVKIPRHKLGRYELDPDSQEQLIIVGYNSTRNDTNEQLRRQVGRKGEPQIGDVVICLRNSYENGVFNGMRGRILGLEPEPWREGYMADIQVFGEDEIYRAMISADQFGKPKTMSEINRRFGLWDYGYAMTCHKAQGSQADKVVVIEERMPQSSDANHARWLYTAITRAAKELILVG